MFQFMFIKMGVFCIIMNMRPLKFAQFVVNLIMYLGLKGAKEGVEAFSINSQAKARCSKLPISSSS